MLFLRNQVKSYVLLFEGRTGSSYLTTSLNDHPDVLAKEEALVKLKPQGADAQADWTRRTLTPPLIGRNKVIGFKTKLRDIADPIVYAAVLRELEVCILHMQRKNTVKAAISEINCNILKERTNYYNVYDKKDRLPPVEIPLEQFRHELRVREQRDQVLQDFVKDLSLPTLAIFYEDILLDESALMDRVYNFLGVRALQTRGKSFKNTSDDLRLSITNFDELRAAYEGTAYTTMFDEVLVPQPPA